MERELNGLFDEPGPQAPGADPDTLGVPIHEGTNALKIWVKDTSGLVVRMTDVLAERCPLVAYVANAGHGVLLVYQLDDRQVGPVTLAVPKL